MIYVTLCNSSRYIKKISDMIMFISYDNANHTIMKCIASAYMAMADCSKIIFMLHLLTASTTDIGLFFIFRLFKSIMFF